MSTALVEQRPKIGRPEEITPSEAAEYFEYIEAGASLTQAAALVGHSRPGMEEYVQRHPELASAHGRAKAAHVLKHSKNLDRISSTEDPRAYNAAVRASEIQLAAHDERYRKVKDGGSGPGSGVQIVVQCNVPGPQVSAFVGAGGDVQGEAVTVIEHKAAPEIPEAAPAGRIATGAPVPVAPDVVSAHEAPATQAAQDVAIPATREEQGSGKSGGAEWF
jgi:hypothetical protein